MVHSDQRSSHCIEDDWSSCVNVRARRRVLKLFENISYNAHHESECACILSKFGRLLGQNCTLIDRLSHIMCDNVFILSLIRITSWSQPGILRIAHKSTNALCIIYEEDVAN